VHQPFEHDEDRPHRSPFRAGSTGDLYWHWYYRGYRMGDPDLGRDGIAALRWDQEHRMFNPYEMWNRAANDQDEPLFYTKTVHTVDFKCQCKVCVKKTTINMQDAAFLRSIGVVWRVPSEKEINARS
jgi:hypothetical protein